MSFRNRNQNQRFNNAKPYDYPSRAPPPMSYALRTPEQLEFELEFTKWEKGFEDWKADFSNHPDRAAYRQYEQKFLDVRAKLLEKKKQLFAPPKQSLEEQFQNQLSAASHMADSILQKFGEMSGSNYNSSMGGGGYGQQNFSRAPQYRDQMQFRQDNFGNQRNQPRNDSFRAGRNQNRNNDFNTYKTKSKPVDPNSVYPNNPWVRINHENPPLIGKRKKVKNAKILKYLNNLENEGERTKEEEDALADIAKKMEEAKNPNSPLKVSGAARRKYHSLSAKNEEDRTEYEKKFIEYFKFVRLRRGEMEIASSGEDEEEEEKLEVIDRKFEELRQATEPIKITGSVKRKYTKILTKNAEEHTEYDKKYIDYFRSAVLRTEDIHLSVEDDLTKITRRLEAVKNGTEPLKVSGAARRKYFNIHKKKPEDRTEYDNKFVEYVDYVRTTYRELQAQKNQTEFETATGTNTEDLLMETQMQSGEMQDETIKIDFTADAEA